LSAALCIIAPVKTQTPRINRGVCIEPVQFRTFSHSLLKGPCSFMEPDTFWSLSSMAAQCGPTNIDDAASGRRRGVSITYKEEGIQ
ncbi:hypothetical protein ACNFCJ_23490, partial [Pseudomonas sp. NY15364]|uniref:hypothetical protein n=1 Tax=Pseudomonas sp. NY15364 TaxID=3400353 RepID=UPI003A89817F